MRGVVLAMVLLACGRSTPRPDAGKVAATRTTLTILDAAPRAPVLAVVVATDSAELRAPSEAPVRVPIGELPGALEKLERAHFDEVRVEFAADVPWTLALTVVDALQAAGMSDIAIDRHRDVLPAKVASGEVEERAHVAVVALSTDAVFVNGQRVASRPAAGSGPIAEVVSALEDLHADGAVIDVSGEVEARFVVRILDSVTAAGCEKVSISGGPPAPPEPIHR